MCHNNQIPNFYHTDLRIIGINLEEIKFMSINIIVISLSQ